MQVKDIMTRSVLTVSPNATVQEVAQLLLERRICTAPVVTGEGTLIGIVSEGDVMTREIVSVDEVAALEAVA